MRKLGQRETKIGIFEFFENKLGIITKYKSLVTTTNTYIEARDGPVFNISEFGLEGIKYLKIPDDVFVEVKKIVQQRKLKNLKLVHVDTSMETGIKYYRLNSEIPRDLWNKVKEHFYYYRDEDEDTESGYELRGWLTTDPGDVEKLLSIKEENTIENRRKQYAEASKKQVSVERELTQKINDINEQFKDAEYPVKETQHEVDGEVIQNPRNPQNIYGGGEWWIITTEHVWYVQNNGMDGDDWSRNNIRTGGAGAVGVRVPFSEELAEKIRSLKVGI